MQKSIGNFAFSVFAAPLAGAGYAWLVLLDISRMEGAGNLKEFARWCAENDGAGRADCIAQAQANSLLEMSSIVLAATALLPAGYWIAVRLMARNRAALGRGFPILVRVCLGLLPLILVGHAALAAYVLYERMQLGTVRPNGYLLLAVGAFVGGLLLSAFNILTGMRRMLAVEPVRATGFALGAGEMPALRERVQRLAARLGAVEPRNVVVGIEPMPYMISTPVRLRGEGDLPEGETLYLPTTALRVLDDTELDALIARELAHFRGDDLVFSRRFAPAHAGLEHAVDDSADDDESEHYLLRAAKLPAYGMLSYMLWVLKDVLARVTVEREQLADRAALDVAPAPRVASMIAKLVALGAQWPAFREGLKALMNRGVGRRNLAEDYLRRTREFLTKSDSATLARNLADMSVPHPYDRQQPSLSVRVLSLDVDDKAAINAALLALRLTRPPAPDIIALEERLTRADLDYTRVPGHPIEISEGAELPPELA